MNAAIKLTEDQQRVLPEGEKTAFVDVTDDAGRRYVLIPESAWDRIKTFLDAEAIDPSLYEAEEVELFE